MSNSESGKALTTDGRHATELIRYASETEILFVSWMLDVEALAGFGQTQFRLKPRHPSESLWLTTILMIRAIRHSYTQKCHPILEEI